MKFLNTLLIFMLISIVSQGQSITGEWTTFDDKTKEKKAIIEIYKENDAYFGKIVENFVSEKNAVCENCKGTNKGKPIIGLIIIEDMEKDGDEYTGGTILDPENGKTYSCNLQLEKNNRLKVRGYLGFSLLGRTQYWVRSE